MTQSNKHENNITADYEFNNNSNGGIFFTVALVCYLFFLLASIVGFISFGYIQKHNGLNGDKLIGIGILLVTFVLMPLFLYSRFKNKETRERMLNLGLKKKEDTDNQ